MHFTERLYGEKMCKFVRMKKRLTLFLDEPLIAKMKSLAQTKGTSMSLLVEEILFQQLIIIDSSLFTASIGNILFCTVIF